MAGFQLPFSFKGQTECIARLTAKQYLKEHRRLRRLYLAHPRFPAVLKLHEQWSLHQFFVFTEQLTEAQLLKYRELVTSEMPSTPHQAGRALKQLDLILSGRAKPNHSTFPALDRYHSDRRMQTLVNPEIDIEQMTRAFWVLAKQDNTAAWLEQHDAKSELDIDPQPLA